MGEYVQEKGWFPDNLSRIQTALCAHKTRPGQQAQQPFAVFDFDNTCIFRDIGQAMFRHQLLQLYYRIPPATLAALIPEQGPQLAHAPWQVLREAILSHYALLWPYLEKNQREEAKKTSSYLPFTVLLYWFVLKAREEENLGSPYVLALLAKLQAGFTLQELQSFCSAILKETQEEQLAINYLGAKLPDPLGNIEASYPTGLKVFEEMRELMKTLLAHNITPYVISASSDWLVKTAAEQLGFPVQEGHIFGVRTSMNSEGRVLPESARDFPLTYRKGKSEVIDRFIGNNPFLVAGDADTDYEMLTRPDAKLRLLINRKQKGLIAQLYTDPEVLLQGVDTERGCFRPSRETIGA